MNRITNCKYTEAISYAFSLLPIIMVDKLQYIHFLTGTDPIYAGLHNFIDINDKRSYRNTAHVCYSWNALNRHEPTTVVLPLLNDANPYTIIHELGHCLDEAWGFSHNALPINNYAKTDRYEAFAEAFACQYFWLGAKAEDIFQSDGAIQYLFKGIEDANKATG